MGPELSVKSNACQQIGSERRAERGEPSNAVIEDLELT